MASPWRGTIKLQLGVKRYRPSAHIIIVVIEEPIKQIDERVTGVDLTSESDLEAKLVFVLSDEFWDLLINIILRSLVIDLR